MSAPKDNDQPATVTDTIDDNDDAALRWTTHPVKRKPWTAVFVTVFILVVSYVVLWVTESQWFAFIALVVLFASVAKFYLPTRFALTDEGVMIKTTMTTIKKDWAVFRSFYPDKNGVLLSPFTEPSRLENFRGLYLMFEDNRDEVLAKIREHIGKEAEPPRDDPA